MKFSLKYLHINKKFYSFVLGKETKALRTRRSDQEQKPPIFPNKAAHRKCRKMKAEKKRTFRQVKFSAQKGVKT